MIFGFWPHSCALRTPLVSHLARRVGGKKADGARAFRFFAPVVGFLRRFFLVSAFGGGTCVAKSSASLFTHTQTPTKTDYCVRVPRLLSHVFGSVEESERRLCHDRGKADGDGEAASAASAAAMDIC